MPDIDDHAECCARAGIGGPGFGMRHMRSGTGEHSRNAQNAQPPQHDRESPIIPWSVMLTIWTVRWHIAVEKMLAITRSVSIPEVRSAL
jgi:hypothetical protein